MSNPDPKDNPITKTARDLAPRAFQFTLRELIFFVLLAALVQFVIYWTSGGSHLLTSPFQERAKYLFRSTNFQNQSFYFLLISILTLLFIGAFVYSSLPARRWIVRPLLAVLFPVFLYCIIPGFLINSYPRIGYVENACRSFATEQDYFFRSAHEYAPTLHELAKQGSLDKGLVNAEGAQGVPYNGYMYKILTGQGAGAKGGAKSYLVDGKYKDGYALLAWPAFWDDPARESFIVSRDGAIYLKDLGPDTEKLASEMKDFDPTGWQETQ